MKSQAEQVNEQHRALSVALCVPNCLQ